MHNIYKNIPEPVAGIAYMACGAIILLDAMGAIKAGLLVIVGGLFLLWHGFVLVQGPQKFARWMERMNQKK